ncbi:HAD-IC family P-type ATPase [Roseiconus nitratireducens]|uniref:HAD-IC family P-type ATPase n=1 Tax=Roseiconus nitratireducens TaxID=2605748 RepID=A0A5M6DNS2_9BACT|nr:HAD-IC family P-type ATPase [Roseiconus nitratireducens]KAA5547085.1 HAD-IC family P-type ATPase [Roseiconus nitratireducens]
MTHQTETPRSIPSNEAQGKVSKQPWASLTVDEVLKRLETDANDGLTSDQVRQRSRRYGANTLQTSDGPTWPQVLARQFFDALILILLIAAGISLAIGEWTDAVTILAIVLLNGLLGFFQEWKAERALADLRNLLQPTCQVVRDGEEQTIEASGLVPGDLVRIVTGSRIPADVRLTRTLNLAIDESALTGESVSSPKRADAVPPETPLAERASMVWMGTAATAGRGDGVVVNIGAETEFGRIAALTESIDRDTTPLQRKLGRLGKQLGIIAILVSLSVGVAGYWAGQQPPMEMFLTAISLAVAVVPEGLPAVVTLTLALGVREMVRRKALLRRLRAAEGLGAATVVCTDKTGTLTQNEMTVRQIWLSAGAVDVTGVGYDPAGHFESGGQRVDYRDRGDLLLLLEAGLHCNHAALVHDAAGWHGRGEPTEGALVVGAYKAWLEPPASVAPVAEFSFSSDRKRMTVVEHARDGLLAYVKGAPEIILERCVQIRDGDQTRPMEEADERRARQAFSQMAAQGLRTLAIAQRPLSRDQSLDEDQVEQQLELLGIVGMMDPPRVSVPQAIQVAGQAGIRVLMITGDSAVTATAIARQIGLRVDRAITGQELNALSDDELARSVRERVLFARTTPEHKLRIVTALQSQGEIVGMTGDGVNDAPALKKADIGIAMGKRGTDVAKGVSDIVLTDDNFSSIVGAIEEGRRQYDNIQKFVRYLLSSNTGEVVAIFCNILIGGPLIFLPVQILWMNLVTDGMTAVALGLEPAEKSVMQRPPRRPSEPVLDARGFAMILALGSYIGLASLWLFHDYLSSGDPVKVAAAQTAAFTCIVLIEKANVLNFRSLRSPLHHVGFFSNPWVLAALALTISLQVAAVYVPVLQNALRTVPLDAETWGRMVVLVLPVFVIPELCKWLWSLFRHVPDASTADQHSSIAVTESVSS